MKNDMIWAFLIHLSRNLWDDTEAPVRGLYMPHTKEENETDPETWDAVIAALPAYGINTLVIDLGDAIVYDSHPEIAAPDAWSKEFFKKKLDEVRALGITPIPKLNFSAGHDRWMKDYSRMISTPIYYQVCADLIKEVCELFDSPAYFHLGMDEETEQYQRYNLLTTIRNEQLWWHDLRFLATKCEKYGARPWIWANCTLEKYPKTFTEQMPKSVIMTNGYYGKYYNEYCGAELKKKSDHYIDFHHFYNDNGYDQIPLCSTWRYRSNPFQTLALVKDQLDSGLIKGFIMATWLHTVPDEKHGLIHGAEKLYYARKTVYPETLE